MSSIAPVIHREGHGVGGSRRWEAVDGSRKWDAVRGWKSAHISRSYPTHLRRRSNELEEALLSSLHANSPALSLREDKGARFLPPSAFEKRTVARDLTADSNDESTVFRSSCNPIVLGIPSGLRKLLNAYESGRPAFPFLASCPHRQHSRSSNHRRCPA